MFLWVEVAPYWNVNMYNPNLTQEERIVEVAPYWNVNYEATKFVAEYFFVEVAPYWNVNLYYGYLYYHSFS